MSRLIEQRKCLFYSLNTMSSRSILFPLLLDKPAPSTLLRTGFSLKGKGAGTWSGVHSTKEKVKQQPQSIAVLTLFIPVMLLLLSCHSVYAEEPGAPPRPTLTVKNITKAKEVLRDPTVITEKQAVEGLAFPATKNTTAAPDRSRYKDELKDPTQMNQNFREALNRITQNRAGTVAPGTGVAPAAPMLPKMSLLASVFGGHKQNNSAMLSINNKTELVYVGDKITTLDNNRVVEIQILEIHKHHVKVKVLPDNETIILR
jgi:hypothetical protein